MGRTLRIGHREAVILHVSAYERDDHERGLYKPMLEMKAGEAYCPRLMNAILLCIVTGKGKTLGSRVRIDEIELRGVRFDGPGRVTDALGITTANARGSARIVDDLCVEVDLDVCPLQAPRNAGKKQSKQEPRISKKMLAKYLPGIVTKFLAEKHPITLQEYLNLLLETCGSEWELRKRI
ncbi:MAG: hypothetical protein Q8R32_02445, partial [bacterium]|nr:hypothetical protein [bacterium]